MTREEYAERCASDWMADIHDDEGDVQDDEYAED